LTVGGTGTPLLLTRQFQAQSNRYARLVAPIIERIDLGAASNLMGVRICLTPSFEPIPIHLARPVWSATGATGAGSGVGLDVWGCRHPPACSGI